MLRISQTKTQWGTAIKLEGRLLAPWVDELMELFGGERTLAAGSLDLSELSFVDEAGAGLLRMLLARGFKIDSCTPFIAELLQLNRSLHSPGDLP